MVIAAAFRLKVVIMLLLVSIVVSPNVCGGLYKIRHGVISIFAEESADCFTSFMRVSFCRPMYDCTCVIMSLSLSLCWSAVCDVAFPWCVVQSL